MTDLTSIDSLFAQGRNKAGLTLLNQYLVEYPEDQQQSYRRAIVAEQLATKEEVKSAYMHCLRVCKDNVLAYLYAGTFFLKLDELEAALSILIVGQQIDSRITSFYRFESVEPQTRERSYHADMALRQFFTQQHKEHVGEDPAVKNIFGAIWPQTHDKNFQYLTEQQRPHLFYLPHLTAKAFWPNSEGFDVSLIENEFSELKQEFLAVKDKVDEFGEPYLGEEYKKLGFDKLAGSNNWTALHLYKDGVQNEELVQHVPHTLATLAKLPLYDLSGAPYEVFYSVLRAGQHITPHYGLSNHSLTVHLPIIVPGEGYIKVGNHQQQWQEGKIAAFDDSYIHEAINLSDGDRVVLIFSVWHPGLTEQERAAIRRTFSARQSWQSTRKDYLEKLL